MEGYKHGRERHEKSLHHHRHPTQCIPLIERLWTGSGEGRTAATHTHKGERGQRSPPTREKRRKKKKKEEEKEKKT